jgi:transcriptional regulator with XRE-family HTH domain
MTAPGPATSGIADLDRTLGGLFWGDNVVWEVRRQASVEPFVRALVSAGGQAEAFAHVSLSGEASAGAADGDEVIDASATGPCARPGELLTAVRAFARRAERTILVFDPLDAMAERWGLEIARRFFVRCCPMLLEIGAIAYWSIGSSDALAPLRREVEQVTQCVLVVDDHRVRIAKADGRPPGVEGSVLSLGVGEDGEVRLTATPAAARLAVALRSLRERRNLSQTDLARLAGVSPSAISHAERGQSGLSLDTLLDLSAHLNVTLDELLRGDAERGYQLARRHDPSERSGSSLLPLLDEPGVGLRVFLARLPPRASGEPDARHKGVEAVTVARGLVQIELGDRRAALRAGEALVAEASSITGWRNVGEAEAMLFWVLRDPRRAESA